jgi:zinc protease
MKTKIKIFVFIISIVLFYINPAFAIDAKREILPNGLTLLYTERHNLPLLKVTLLIKASPLDEPAQKAGLANLVASLLTEGTRHRTSEMISEEVEFIGAHLGASTDRDYTMVNLSVLKKDIQKGFELFSDILLNPTFPDEEIKRVKELIKGALKQSEDDPSFVAERAFRKALYGTEHAYGRVVEGSLETLDNITRDDIENFYKAYYRPNNAILVIAGDIDYQEIKNLISRYLSAWQPAPIPKRTIPEVSPPESPKILKIDKNITQANIIIGHLGVSRSNPDYYALSVMNYILGGGGFASRLMTKIRDEMGLAYDVYSLFSSDLEPGVFRAAVQTKNESAKKVIGVILDEMRHMQSEPVLEGELRDAKSYLTGSFPRRIDTLGKIADFLALTEFYGLGMDYDRRYPEYINSVTKDDILRVAQRYLHPDSYILVVVGDIKRTGL